jgi:hypothetical protein
MALSHFLTFVNLGLCFAWGLSAMCRLAKMHGRTRLRVELFYLALFVASVFSGLQYWLFGTFAGWPDVAASVAICGLLWLTMPHWRHGPPPASCVRA